MQSQLTRRPAPTARQNAAHRPGLASRPHRPVVSVAANSSSHNQQPSTSGRAGGSHAERFDSVKPRMAQAPSAFGSADNGRQVLEKMSIAEQAASQNACVANLLLQCPGARGLTLGERGNVAAMLRKRPNAPHALPFCYPLSMQTKRA